MLLMHVCCALHCVVGLPSSPLSNVYTPLACACVSAACVMSSVCWYSSQYRSYHRLIVIRVVCISISVGTKAHMATHHAVMSTHTLTPSMMMTLLLMICSSIEEEWVEIVEPESRRMMYANVLTGESHWVPPKDIK